MSPLPPQHHGRRTQPLYRRRRLAALFVAAVLAIAGVALWRTFDSGSGPVPAGAGAGTMAAQAKPRLVAKKLGASLPAPVSGEAVVRHGGRLLVLGGLDAASQSASGVFRLDPQTGGLTPAGMLAQPLHDAAASSLGGRVLVLGGGASTSTRGVEVLGSSGNGRIISHLPTPRSDLAAAPVGGRVYLIGGYDGKSLSGAILQTSDGRSFSTLARLPMPVRYPAVASSGDTIYVFGGETASGRRTLARGANT